MDEDLSFIGQMVGLVFEKVQKNKNVGKNTNELSGKYFDQLPRSMVVKLFKLYKVDFEMFGYSVDSFLT